MRMLRLANLRLLTIFMFYSVVKIPYYNPLTYIMPLALFDTH